MDEFLNHGSLFTGIGGFDLAAQWAGLTNVFQVEIDKYCNKVLEKNFPDVKRYKNIKEFDGKKYKGAIDILSGGFPCQPFSVAGKQKGAEDDRNLWPEMFRVIKEIQPTWVVGENVANIINFVEFENILADLEGEGYEVQTFIIPALAVDAKHRRNRCWIVANRDTNSGNRNKGPFEKVAGRKNTEPTRVCTNVADSEKTELERAGGSRTRGNRFTNSSLDIPNANGKRLEKQWTNFAEQFSLERGSEWLPEPGVGRVANGVSNRVDRLKGLGNAVVPQIPYRIFMAIKKGAA